MTTEIKNLNLDQIRIDGGTQPRATIDTKVVAEYAELYGQGVKFPPVTVFFDGTNYWLADGFHRYWANKKINCDYVFAEVHPGTQRDAILYSVGANAEHGLRRTNADKRKAVLIMLEDEEWSQWSNREIAKQCGVSEFQVRKTREGLSAIVSQMEQKARPVKYKRGGKTHIQKTRSRDLHRGPDSPNPVRQPRIAPAQTCINLPHDPTDGARAIVSAMGAEYAEKLIVTLTSYLQEKKVGVA